MLTLPYHFPNTDKQTAGVLSFEVGANLHKRVMLNGVTYLDKVALIGGMFALLKLVFGALFAKSYPWLMNLTIISNLFKVDGSK